MSNDIDIFLLNTEKAIYNYTGEIKTSKYFYSKYYW